MSSRLSDLIGDDAVAQNAILLTFPTLELLDAAIRRLIESGWMDDEQEVIRFAAGSWSAVLPQGYYTKD